MFCFIHFIERMLDCFNSSLIWHKNYEFVILQERTNIFFGLLNIFGINSWQNQNWLFLMHFSYPRVFCYLQRYDLKELMNKLLNFPTILISSCFSDQIYNTSFFMIMMYSLHHLGSIDFFWKGIKVNYYLCVRTCACSFVSSFSLSCISFLLISP